MMTLMMKMMMVMKMMKLCVCVSVPGSELCSYELAAHKYPALPERFSKCPKLPVPPRYVPPDLRHGAHLLITDPPPRDL